MTVEADEWPTILPKRALHYFRTMCVKRGDVKTDIQRMGHVQELSRLLPPTATRINLNVVSDTQLELVYKLGQKMYRLTGTMTGEVSHRFEVIDEVREVPTTALNDSETGRTH